MAETTNSTLIKDNRLLDKELSNIIIRDNHSVVIKTINDVIEKTVKEGIDLINQDTIVFKTDEPKIFENHYIPLDFAKGFIHRKEYSSINYVTENQNWIGFVTEKNDENRVFTAELTDLTTDTGTKEFAEFSYDDISPDDLKLFEVGAVFYWNFGRVCRKGTVKKESTLTFQRSIPWTEEEFNRAADRSKEYENIKWE